MPRKPDPALEQTIVDSALRLLDENGLNAITMREIAKAARTTTPTIYERFHDHDAILRAVLERVATDIAGTLEPSRNIEEVGDRFLTYCCQHPHRMELIHRVWPATMITHRPRPTYELVLSRLKKEHGHSAKKADEVASALMALLLGTALLMLGAGLQSEFADVTERIGRKAFRALCKGI